MRRDGAFEGALLPPGWRPDRETAPPAEPAPRRAPRRAGPGGGIVVADGTEVFLRPLGPGDRQMLAEAFEHLSPTSRYHRFLAPMPRLSPSLLTFLTDVDQVHHFVWAAVAEETAGSVGVGTSRFVRLPDPAAADAAVTVVDAYQGRGIGSLLLDALVLRALEVDISRFEGLILAENMPSRAMLAGAGAHFEPDGGGVLRYTLDLPARARELADSPLHAVLRRYPPTATLRAPSGPGPGGRRGRRRRPPRRP